MSWLALGDSSARDDLQRRMRVSCSRGQIRDCCFCRAAAVISSLDNLRAAAPCVRLLFMAPVAIGSSGWRTTAAACAWLHYIASHGFLLTAKVTPGGSCIWYVSTWRLLLLLAAASAPGGYFCFWRLLLLLAAASANVCQQHRLTGGSSITVPAAPPDRLQQLPLTPCGTCVILVSSPSSA
ncbi:unnamed protein product [Closterium sp. NIES-64]|nr:unnamed protein product [Closterium sp. NIES-64]